MGRWLQIYRIMLKTLYAKLAIGLIALLIVIGLVYALISTSTTRLYLEEVNQKFNKDLAFNLVADRNLVAEGHINKDALKETFHQYMVINPSIEIYLLDIEGTILSFSADPGKVKRKRVSLEPIQAFLSGDQGYPLLGDDPRSHDGRKAFSVTQVPSAQNPEGYLYVVLRGEEFDSVDQVVQESYFLRLSSWAVFASLSVGLIAGLIVFYILTRRLRRLSVLMDDFQQKNFNSHLKYSLSDKKYPDEIDHLGLAFDQMAERIQKQIDELNEKDNLRRKLVAQVSHDLRTPLASMQGYLESLKLMENKLSPEERENYLSIALRQGQRLSQQVSELFELAALDARETQPTLEAFAIAELLHDIVQKYQLKASREAIQLKLHLPKKNPPLVTGDIKLTERVLENLIENAFVHTPSQGTIDFSIAQKIKDVQVSVTDSGPGIAQHDLPHIFEPFFQSKENTKKTGHAGLGLAISRRIMELQNGSLYAENVEPQGAVFVISLPIEQKKL